MTTETTMEMRDKILNAAVKIAEKTPLHSVTRGAIAKKAKCAPSLVTWYLGGWDDLRSAIVDKAVAEQNLPVLAHALAARHPGVSAAPQWVKAAALKLLAQ